ncbi:ParB N-terminal domain-containing protein [Melghirimyces algeriensis]|uniref:ParB-like nuclease domain-containing protein n=1 Tax=Melghirimyces algeriensis TaxID=910412 RepID=A0A521F200_9BACL|nr:ParB N-terminal domain-containing protein [Melghirimyces algeriensis]SMO90215.1 ParB-like nuclease domain-containing protein [Melghirimyces algeriensis]
MSLKLVETERIRLHEQHEAERLEKTCQQIQKDGILWNPIIGMELSNGECMVLDGAHRYASLVRLGCQRIPVQVVHPMAVTVGAWDHVVKMGKWMKELHMDPECSWVGRKREDIYQIEWKTAEGTQGCFGPSGDHPSMKEQLEVWHRLVRTYSEAGPVRRVRGEHVSLLREAVLFRHPVLQLSDLTRLVETGNVLPAGVTRVTVQGRLVNLGIPLEWLQKEKPVESMWKAQCREWEQKVFS